MKLLLKHGTDEEIRGYLGDEGELLLEPSTPMLYIMDGIKIGGSPIATVSINVGTVNIIAPPQEYIGTIDTQVIGSPYSGNGEHVASEWQIASDAEFTSTVYDSGRTTEILTTLIPSAVNANLQSNNSYYARVRYISSFGIETPWSEPVRYSIIESGPYKINSNDWGFGDFPEGKSWTSNTSFFMPEGGGSLVEEVDGYLGIPGTEGCYVLVDIANYERGDLKEISLSVYTDRSNGWEWESYGHVELSEGGLYLIDMHDKPGLISTIQFHQNFYYFDFTVNSITIFKPEELPTYTIAKPSILYPANESVIDGDTNVSGSVFSGDGVHMDCYWEIATDAAFTDIVGSNPGGRSITPFDFPQVSNGRSYYIRVRYLSSMNLTSEWSDAMHYNTNAASAGTASITDPVDGATLELPAYIYSSTFNGDGEHIASYWEIATSARFDDLIYSSGATYARRTWIHTAELGSIFNAGSSYYVRVKYESSAGLMTAWSEVVSFSTSKGPAVITANGKLLVTDGVTLDYAGYATAISADGYTAIMGVYGDDDKGSVSGSACVYTFNGTSWIQQQKLVASDGAANDNFGTFVAISADGTTALISSHYDDDGGNATGSAYVFVKTGSTWTQQAKLVAADPYALDLFGKGVALSSNGDYAAVCSPQDDDINSSSGSVYIFKRSGTTWAQQAKISLPVGQNKASGFFGSAVSISGDGDIAVIGQYAGNNDSGTATGAAYVYTRDGTTWTQQTKLVPTDAGSGDQFGWSVSISTDGNFIAIGSPYNYSKGSVSTYTKTDGVWGLHSKVFAGDGQSSDFFGYAVAINATGDGLLVGANGDDDKGSASGSAYLFTRMGAAWRQETKIKGADLIAGDGFGYSVSIAGDSSMLVIGAYNDDDKGTNSGSAYVFGVTF